MCVVRIQVSYSLTHNLKELSRPSENPSDQPGKKQQLFNSQKTIISHLMLGLLMIGCGGKLIIEKEGRCLNLVGML